MVEKSTSSQAIVNIKFLNNA